MRQAIAEEMLRALIVSDYGHDNAAIGYSQVSEYLGQAPVQRRH